MLMIDEEIRIGSIVNGMVTLNSLSENHITPTKLRKNNTCCNARGNIKHYLKGVFS